MVYERYKTSDANGFIGVNDNFKQELFNNLKCEDISIKNIKSLRYKNKDLTNFFINYNECTSSKFAVDSKKRKEDQFNLSIKAGLNNSSLDIQSINLIGRNANFGSQIGVRFGIEIEYILPFNENKWSLFLEPTYRKFEAEKEILGIPTPTVPFDDKITVN